MTRSSIRSAAALGRGGPAPIRRPGQRAAVVLGLLLLNGAGPAGAEPAAETKPGLASDRSVAPAAPRAGAGQTSAPGQGSDAEPYRSLVTREAQRQGLPPAVADAVAFVESGYNPGVVGTVGELGLMQVRPATAALLGHRGPPQALLDPETNVRFGVAYLAKAWQLAEGNLCRALMKYRAGHGEERMSPRSVAYCRQARERLAAFGSPLAEAPLPDAAPGRLAQPPASLPSGRSRQAALAPLIRRLWAEHATRVRASEARAERIMRGG